jgi:hypothetical protein
MGLGIFTLNAMKKCATDKTSCCIARASNTIRMPNSIASSQHVTQVLAAMHQISYLVRPRVANDDPPNGFLLHQNHGNAQ